MVNVFNEVSVAYLLLIAQPIFAIVGMTYNILGLYDALVDHRLSFGEDESKHVPAQAHVEWEAIRLAVQALLTTIGLLTLVYMPPPDRIFAQPFVVIANRLCLIAATGLLMAKSILGQRYQHKLQRIWLREHGAKE